MKRGSFLHKSTLCHPSSQVKVSDRPAPHKCGAGGSETLACENVSCHDMKKTLHNRNYNLFTH